MLTAVASRVEIVDSDFSDNQSSGLGGAIVSLGSDVRISRSEFTSNRSRVGGAVFLWVSGDSALFAGNRSDVGGAIAHWAAVTPSPVSLLAFSELTALTGSSPQTLNLSRGVFVENQAIVHAAAVQGGAAEVALGNALVIRNTLSTPGGGAALEGSALTLYNSTIADNPSGGLMVPAPAGHAQVLNSIVLRNTGFGCRVPPGKLTKALASLQSPANDCEGIPMQDPRLGTNYKPVVDSSVSTSGDVATCISAPLVAAFDLASTNRGNRGVCAIGAYEPDPRLDQDTLLHSDFGRWLRILIVSFFMLLGFLFLFWLARRRRRKSRAMDEPC